MEAPRPLGQMHGHGRQNMRNEVSGCGGSDKTHAHHTTPDRSATQHSTAQHSATQHRAPHRTTPHHTTPHYTTPHPATRRHSGGWWRLCWGIEECVSHCLRLLPVSFSLLFPSAAWAGNLFYLIVVCPPPLLPLISAHSWGVCTALVRDAKTYRLRAKCIN